MLHEVTPERAREFIAASRFIWHQRFALAPGVTTPGPSNVSFLLDRAGIPADLTGSSVIDIGTANGGCAFEVERRGATRVVAVDMWPPERFGFSDLKRLYDSDVEFVQSNVYELPERVEEQFDLVLFFGVLYHLRHPLLGLDRVREVSKREIAVETAVCDHEIPALREEPYVRFYRSKELKGDGSNWFAPSVRALTDWMGSCGFDVTRTTAWPEDAPQRAIVSAVRGQGTPEFRKLTYEPAIASVRTQPV
jgi:tRNA (mo5U34)-methyltransferase